MEHVSPTSSSSTIVDGGNPFLEDVVKPFLNYGGSKKGEKKATLGRRKRGDNPFQPTERGRAGSDFGSSAQSAHVLGEGRGKSEEAETGFSLEGRQPELSSATHPSEAAGDMEPLSIDSGVELQFNALMQLLEQPDNQASGIETVGKEETKANKKLPPRPPDRTTSLAKAESPKIDENFETKNQLEKREPDIVHENRPLCLSVETFQRFSVNYEVEATSDESLQDQEIVEALKPEPAVQETSDFDVSEDGFSESDKKDEEEVTFDFITAADLSEEPSEGKRSNVGSVCVSDERDSGEREPACNIERVSRDPIQPESDREPSNDELPRDSAAHRLSADCQSSLASQQVPSGAEQTADCESNSEGRSRSHLRPEEASQFVEEDMRINMIQPVYSQAHQVRRIIHFCTNIVFTPTIVFSKFNLLGYFNEHLGTTSREYRWSGLLSRITTG